MVSAGATFTPPSLILNFKFQVTQGRKGQNKLSVHSLYANERLMQLYWFILCIYLERFLLLKLERHLICHV